MYEYAGDLPPILDRKSRSLERLPASIPELIERFPAFGLSDELFICVPTDLGDEVCGCRSFTWL